MHRAALAASVVAVACAGAVLVPSHLAGHMPVFAAPRQEPTLTFPDAIAWRTFRTATLRTADVWNDTDPRQADLAANPPDDSGYLSADTVSCRFHPTDVSGTTPKFRCILPNGEIVRVKYGAHTGEIFAETAATRLLQALGFGADDMFLVPRVRCYECPRLPYEAAWALDWVWAQGLIRHLPRRGFTDFEWASVERRRAGTNVAFGDDDGWAWNELDAIDPHLGASRAEIDAFRLVAVFLSHWDNKASNQRLVCESPIGERTEECPRAFAFIQDAGATFGPNKLSLEGWRETPIWSDPRSCVVSMHHLPYGGSTFGTIQISEPGRALLLRQLSRLTDTQIASLFRGARFDAFAHSGAAVQLDSWTTVFKSKRQEIGDGGPCPLPSPL